MLGTNSAIYVGKHFEDGYLGYVALDNFFGVLSIEEGITKEEGKEVLELIKKQFEGASISSLAGFDNKMSDVILKANLPAHFSLSFGYLQKGVVYLKTIGDGQIYIRRNKDFAKIISGDKSASGYAKEFDCMIFTTSHVNAVIGDVNDIKAFIDHNKPEDIADNMQAEEYGDDDRGLIALFVEFVQQEDKPEKAVSEESDDMSIEKEEETDEDEEEKVDREIEDDEEEEEEEPRPRRKIQLPKNVFAAPMAFLMPKLQQLKDSNILKSKKLTLGIVAVIFCILVWSVTFGAQKKAQADLQKKVDASRELITQKLSDAEGAAFLNPERAMTLIQEAKSELTRIKNVVGDKKPQEITSLGDMIRNKEDTIMKKEEKTYDEFYDLALENKDATGSKMYLYTDSVVILDNKKGAVYELSLPKKSLDKYQTDEVNGATLVAKYKEGIFFFNKDRGIFTFTGKDKAKKVISADTEWGNVVDMFMYTGNIYLLDAGKDEIFKYILISNGFSDKASYFKSGSAIKLSDATSLSIDSSVYIGMGNRVAKFTSGTEEEMKTVFPQNPVKLTKIFTTVDAEKVYAWDKSAGILYILGKNGSYERQIKSNIFTKATDFVVYQNDVYILSEQKIYKMGL